MKEFILAAVLIMLTVSSAGATTMSSKKIKCCVCNSEHEYPVITSTNAFGACDLDLRPPEMQRSTMRYWVQECPECGYVSSEISDETQIASEFLKSNEYISCGGINFKSGLAKRFYRQYMILIHDKDIRAAMFALLHSAWSCDDAKDKVNAKICREKAIPLAAKLAGAALHDSENINMIRADMMRRAGQFEELIREYESVKMKGNARNDPELLNNILRFQIERAREHDDKCYTVKEAMKD
ncbi:MAG: hypothetical protein IJG34_10575 [Synergistaceae bacterium]|nr:hypothetical protein [Synergistaceae bacterium]MBQ3450326.1 hypothetical protein [Synergistaceae bacterium]MBQ3694039.1 hypothetical protein [Synergistaceae bacterium]